MSEAQTENRTRSSRQEEVKVQRRRRETFGADRNLKLHVPEEAKDPNFHYRFIHNRPGRVQQLTQMDDYDIVSKDDVSSRSIGTTVERTADKMDGGSVILVRKPKQFYEEDKAKEAKAIDATEDAMRRGPAPGAEGLSGSDSYVPGGKNVVSGR